MIAQVYKDFLLNSEEVSTRYWQGVNVESRPDMVTRELLNYTFKLSLPNASLDYYRELVKPDLPWADDHFEERVCGYPLNPGTQWANWRLGVGAKDFRNAQGQFNINYMERIWPKFAGMVPPSEVPQHGTFEGLKPLKGIRYEYGDLNDVLKLMIKDPHTRQAYLPQFFPEDTGATHNDRTPCTLGWQFILRNGKLHIVYGLRSCDLVNHWLNDVYMAVRLLLWVLNELKIASEGWKSVVPGTLTMHITSFHVFLADYYKVQRWGKMNSSTLDELNGVAPI